MEVDTDSEKVVLSMYSSDYEDSSDEDEVIVEEQRAVKEFCCYQGCIYVSIPLDTCDTPECSTKLHHICQNNFVECKLDAKFEEWFGIKKQCKKCLNMEYTRFQCSDKH